MEWSGIRRRVLLSHQCISGRLPSLSLQGTDSFRLKSRVQRPFVRSDSLVATRRVYDGISRRAVKRVVVVVSVPNERTETDSMQPPTPQRDVKTPSPTPAESNPSISPQQVAVGISPSFTSPHAMGLSHQVEEYWTTLIKARH